MLILDWSKEDTVDDVRGKGKEEFEKWKWRRVTVGRNSFVPNKELVDHMAEFGFAGNKVPDRVDEWDFGWATARSRDNKRDSIIVVKD